MNIIQLLQLLTSCYVTKTDNAQRNIKIYGYKSPVVLFLLKHGICEVSVSCCRSCQLL